MTLSKRPLFFRKHLAIARFSKLFAMKMSAKVNSAPVQANDDVLTVCAISLLAEILANVAHEGFGHAATALLTGAESGVLTTVAWSSDFDSRLVAAGGTLANLAAALIFWIALRRA